MFAIFDHFWPGFAIVEYFLWMYISADTFGHIFFLLHPYSKKNDVIFFSELQCAHFFAERSHCAGAFWVLLSLFWRPALGHVLI